MLFPLDAPQFLERFNQFVFYLLNAGGRVLNVFLHRKPQFAYQVGDVRSEAHAPLVRHGGVQAEA